MRLRRLSIVLGVTALLGAVLLADASGSARPPPPPGVAVVAAGALPHVCGAADQKFGASGYGPVSGVYYSSVGNGWASAPLCYPLWGNLVMSGPQIAQGGSRVTVAAIPNQGSNSATWAIVAPGAVQWQPAGTPAKGSCLPTTLTCSIVLPPAGPMWQWLLFHVSMPRTYFIDSKGSFCVGQHACAGAVTNAWTYVGIPPAGTKTPKKKQQGTISGNVRETDCSATGCSIKGLGGVAITASGGPGGTAQTSTGTNGNYSVKVDKGTWTVTPSLAGRVFVPASRPRVAVSGDLAGVNFTTCAAARTTQSAVVATTTASTLCDTLHIDWTMPSHIHAVGWDDSPPSQTYINPPNGWEVDLFLKSASGTPLSCVPGHTYTWRIAPRGTKDEKVLESRSCRVKAMVPREGVYTVKVEERQTKTDKLIAKGVKDVVVQDFLIIGLGDSNGSGQANPPYWNRQCDRSTDSYQMRAAEYVESADPRTSVTFVHLACSGARTVHIASQSYVGQEPGAGSPLPPQLIALKVAMASGKPRREIDAMIMSIGINDVRFGGILAVCIKNAAVRPLTGGIPCQDVHVKGALDDNGQPSLAAAPSGSKGYGTLRQVVNQEIVQLPKLFATLKQRIARLVSVKPERIIATTYPDESWRAPGVLCDETSGYFPRLLSTEWGWLSKTGGQLNKAIAAAFATTVTAIPGLFIGHGYCTSASENWFRSITQSATSQLNLFGGFHATREGHIEMGFAVVSTLCKQLYPGQTSTGNCTGMAREPGTG